MLKTSASFLSASYTGKIIIKIYVNEFSSILSRNEIAVCITLKSNLPNHKFGAEGNLEK